MFKRSLVVILCGLSISLSACAIQPNPAGKPLPMITFQHLQKLPISVGMLKTSSEATGVSEAFIISPHDAMRDYMHARFVPKGFSGELQAVIEQADVQHSYEASGSKVGSFLDVGGLDAYAMSIRMRLEYIGEDGGVIHGSVLNAKRVVKVSEHASIAEREKRQLEGAEGLFVDLDEQIRAIVLDQMRLGISLY